MNTQNSTLKKAMIEALRKHLNIVSAACKEVQIDRHTHYNWLKEDEEYKAQVLALNDMVLDFAESALYKQIKDGDTTAIIFFLKTRGKTRGYTQDPTVQVTTASNEKVMVWQN